MVDEPMTPERYAAENGIDLATVPKGVSRDNDPPKHRQCPLCWGGLGGVGVAYSTHGSVSFYKCKVCSHTWKSPRV